MPARPFPRALLEISRHPESLQWPHLTPTMGASAAHRSPRSGGCCAPSRGPTVRSVGSSTATSTASSASRCWLPNRCAPGNSRPSPPGASGSGSGVPTPYPERGHRPGSSRPAGEPAGSPLLAYVDLSEGVEIDDGWFKASGMRSSESHRVVFERAPVLAMLGEPGELVREPYFGRDAIRTAVTWAGIADSAVEGALDILAAKSQGRPPDDLTSLAAGRMLASQGTMDRWLEHAASFVDTNPEASTAHFSTQLRESIAAARDILDVAARAVGSHPFATASDLDRARRDLELFLLQHRLEPALARIGRRAIEQREAWA